MVDPATLYDRPRSSTECPVCSSRLHEFFDFDSRRERNRLNCRGCGDHVLTFEAVRNLDTLTDRTKLARLAHALSKQPAGTLIRSDQLDHMAEAGELPSALELIDNLLMLIASRAQPGGTALITDDALVAPLGAFNAHSAMWAKQEAISLGYVREMGEAHLTIKRAGWERHAELLRNGTRSKHAFMAMDFKPDDVRSLFVDHLVPGVARTGFELRTTDHAEKTAGHIDARMRVELRTSRFVVCDLTHNNRGAYWEAGFAEGIGRPVFYLCRADVLDSQDPEKRPHFDIAHQAIVKWDKANPALAVEELVAMIRATLPGEARMED